MGERAPTRAAEELRRLAASLTALYLEHTGPDAVLLTGSAATGVSDWFSDLDLIVYYHALPSETAIAAARDAAGGRDPGLLAPPSEEAFGETFVVDGVQCQVVHQTVASWEAELRSVLVDLDVDSPLQKAIGGLHDGLALHGQALIERWREETAYPDALADAMVRRYWRFFPLWHVQDRLAARDAVLWRQQALVESAFNLLGTLAGLNRVWFTPFQFKHPRAFAAQLPVAPERLADRIESLFGAAPADAIADLEALVAETQGLLAAHMPEFDATLARGPGTRDLPWAPPADRPAG